MCYIVYLISIESLERLVLNMVLVIKGSVNMEKGTTALLLGAFLEGMKIAGTSLELYYSGLFTLSLFF